MSCADGASCTSVHLDITHYMVKHWYNLVISPVPHYQMDTCVWSFCSPFLFQLYNLKKIHATLTVLLPPPRVTKIHVLFLFMDLSKHRRRPNAFNCNTSRERKSRSSLSSLNYWVMKTLVNMDISPKHFDVTINESKTNVMQSHELEDGKIRFKEKQKKLTSLTACKHWVWFSDPYTAKRIRLPSRIIRLSRFMIYWSICCKSSVHVCARIFGTWFCI